jgi:deazaflavin-dependent oxidoreductase (nitroreductase family)
MQRGFRGQEEKTPFDKVARAFARTRLGGWLFVNVFSVIDRRLIPLTDGRLMVAVGQPVLLLHTRGARCGQPRSTPLLYTRHGDGYVIVASKAGADHHPAWYHNRRAHPDAVTIEVGGRRIPVHPREAQGAEREELWRLVNDNYNGYQVYQQRAASGPSRSCCSNRRDGETSSGLRALDDGRGLVYARERSSERDALYPGG